VIDGFRGNIILAYILLGMTDEAIDTLEENLPDRVTSCRLN